MATTTTKTNKSIGVSYSLRDTPNLLNLPSFPKNNYGFI